MAFQTGSATSADNLLDILNTFAVAQGWTSNMNGTESTGRRVHLQKTAADSTVMYFNLRSSSAEGSFYPGSQSFTYTGLWLNGSTGYNSGNAWHSQPGAPANGSNRFVGGIWGMGGAVANYYLFSTADAIYLVAETATGTYQQLGFGCLDKFDTYTGGQFFFGSTAGDRNNVIAVSGFFGPQESVSPVQGMVFVGGSGVDGITGWMRSNSSGPATQYVRDISQFSRTLWYCEPSAFNSQTLPLPLAVFVSRDGTNNPNSSTPWTPLGMLPNFNFFNMKNYAPAAQYTLGPDNYRVFPSYQKSDQVVTLGSPWTYSGYFGFAIKL